ncbi:hypothetical protein BJ322DRAFT_1096406 [Thelephora terrestris]|uniref:NACHT domain-containing protein n=1 Tax=Thelephora terrestris TaxID=56493 RepID=A0A9P6H354_9AGAM|nr:hypothetical protein BJ322DRAFT_1096406 [Thelephora terrestris]
MNQRAPSLSIRHADEFIFRHGHPRIDGIRLIVLPIRARRQSSCVEPANTKSTAFTLSHRPLSHPTSARPCRVCELMFKKKSKESQEHPARNLSFGLLTNIAVSPLGFRAELDTTSKDEKDSVPSRIVFCERESTVQDYSVPGTSAPVVAIDDTEQVGDSFTREDTCNLSQEEGEPGAASIVTEQDHTNTPLRAPVFPTNDTVEASNGFDSLEALLLSFSIDCINQEGSAAVRNKIKVLLSRITSLGQLFAKRPDNLVDQRRRDELFRELQGIEGNLRPLYESLELQRLTDHIQDVLKLLEDLHEAVFRYQMAWQTAVNNRTLNSLVSVPVPEVVVLDCFYSARRAEYRHGDHNGCLRGTRGDILAEIELWTRDFERSPVYWLNGLAGTGKTTIAQTIAERTFANRRLGASFFCSRDFEDRSNLMLIFPTLAIQLARKFSQFRSMFIPLVQSDPGVVHGSLYDQMNKLIVQPLVESSISTVILIDGLDECKGEEPTSAILAVLGQLAAEIPKVKFFVTSRPEPRIQEGFRLPLLVKAVDVSVLHEVEAGLVDGDIKLFFEHRISELKGRRHGLDDWPTGEQLDLLCERTGGLFIHAMTMVRFIEQKGVDPREQSDRLLRSLDSRFEGKAKFKAYPTLDSLYVTILQAGFGDDDPDGDPMVQAVLGAAILATNPLSPTTIATLLSLDTEHVFRILSSLHPLLVLREDVNHPVRPFHESFSDFVLDPARCIDPRFRVYPPDHHTELLAGCLKIMNQTLEQNICKLPHGVANSEVVDLRERTEKHIDQALQYACQSWHKHLVPTIPTQSPDIIPALRQFLEEKFLFWLEALSVLGAAREAVDALKVTETLLEIWASPVLAASLARDYLRFVVTFFEAISTSALHIYHTALPLSPQKSIIRKLYERYACPTARIVHGLSLSWEPILATFPCQDFRNVAAWSPCNRFIAIAGFGSTKIDIVDAATFKQLNTFQSPQEDKSRHKWLSFSPDCRLLTQFSDWGLTGWDLHTGGPAGTSRRDGSSCRGFSSTYSMDGGIVAIACRNLSDTTVAIATYDLLSWTLVYSYTHPVGHIIPPIWTHDENIQFATVEPGSISIWEIGFSSMKTLAKVESLRLPDEIRFSKNHLFLPTLSRLAFTLPKKVLIWDVRDSKLLLDFTGKDEFSRLSFSSDGRFFACATRLELFVWKETPVGYTLHQNLAFGGTHSILTPSTITDRPVQDRYDFLPAFSSDKTLAAIVQPEEKEVFLRITGSMVAVAGCEEGSCLDIPARGSVVHCDNVRTPAPSHVPLKPSTFTNTSISPNLDYIAIIKDTANFSHQLNIHDMWTGGHLASTTAALASVPYFASDGRSVWCVGSSKSVAGWIINEESESQLIKLEPLGSDVYPLGVLPWESSRGYEVADDGWVLSPNQKRLLWLPHYWRPDQTERVWQGRFLGFLHGEPPEVVILEFFE